MDKIQVIRRTALILGIMLVVGIFVRCAIRWSEVAAVQNSLQRNWEINFNSGGRPRFLPAFADNLAADALMKIYKADVGGRNRGSVYRDRFQSLFRGPIRNLEIYGPDVFDEHLATAISRFGQLEHFGLRDDSGNGSTEEAWESLLQSAARLPKLTELEISGGLLTSRALRKLDGASKLKKLTVEGALDGTCLDGIANLRELRELEITSWENDEGDATGFSSASLAAFLPALARFDRLEVLSFRADRATDEQWTGILQSLARFPNLRELDLDGKSLTNALLAALAGAPKLESLTVLGAVDAGCAPALKALPALKKLRITSTIETPDERNHGLSNASLATLRDALPNVTVNERE